MKRQRTIVKRKAIIIGTNDTPDRVHGRLLEAVDLSGYTFERAYAALKWLLRQDRWRSVSPGYDDIDTFIATMDLAEFRAAREERQDIVKQLAAVTAGQRATERLLGVSQETVARDLGLRDTNVSPQSARNCAYRAETLRNVRQR